MTGAQVSARLLEFIRDQFLNGDPDGQLEESTPLLEWGVLNSMKTVQVINFIRDEIGVSVPPTAINAQNFRDVGNITAMVTELATANA